MLERIVQPTDKSCWATCVSMLTNIDVDLFPLDIESSIGFIAANDRITLDFDAYGRWQGLLSSIGYQLLAWSERPKDKPCILGFVFFRDSETLDSHAIVLEDDTIIDPSPSGFLNGQPVESLAEYCNLLLPDWCFFTVEPVTVS